MNLPRKVFLSTISFIIVGTIVGVLVFKGMELQARAALPPEEQTAEAIAALYDGAVCMACDLGWIVIAMLGSVSVIVALIVWAVYEVGRVVLARRTSTE